MQQPIDFNVQFIYLFIFLTGQILKTSVSFQGLLSTPPQLRQPPVKHSLHSPQPRPHHLLSQSHGSLRSRPTTATTREARSPMTCTNWWTTGQRKPSRQPINLAPLWTRSNSRDGSRTWKAERHWWARLHMRYLKWRCALHSISDIYYALLCTITSVCFRWNATLVPVSSSCLSPAPWLLL